MRSPSTLYLILLIYYTNYNYLSTKSFYKEKIVNNLFTNISLTFSA